MKPLNSYLDEVSLIERQGQENPAIENLTFDSRQAGKGVLFIAQKGSRVDGHDFIDQAVAAGCPAIVCEKLPAQCQPGVVYLQVADSSEALGQLAAVHFGHPSRELKLVGVTGTNGKTTVATLLYRLAMELGWKAGLCSTVANYIGDNSLPATHTTPDALTLQGLLRQMVDAGCDYCFMEVSSHSVVQQRIAGLQFAGGVFTNLTHDHLDYHGTFDAYLKAKKGFFDSLPATAFALVNADDKNGPVMVQNCKARAKFFSLRELADFRVKVLESLFEGMHLELNGQELWTPFIGRFNAANLVAVYGAGVLLGWTEAEVLTALSRLQPVDGRFETLRSADGVTAVVDYAHTPDALKNVLEALNQIRGAGHALITVVGAGGDRDPYKRPIMAAEAVKASTRVILTSDNPRSEDPEHIIAQMLEGVAASDRSKVLSITNRREAIRTACALAQKGDVVLVAGKGHETYQEIKGLRAHFDDREVIRDFFDEGSNNL